MEANREKSVRKEDVQAIASQMFYEGYRAERLSEDHVLIQDPGGKRYQINTLFRTCSCQDREVQRNVSCHHLLGYAELLREQEAYEAALCATLESHNDAWGMTLVNDQIERSLREIGVCEF